MIQSVLNKSIFILIYYLFLFSFFALSASFETIDSYPFSVDIDSDWKPLNDYDREALRLETENQLDILSEKFYDINESYFSPLPFFLAFQTTDLALTCVIQIMRISPQVDYVKSINKDLEDKIKWGRKNGYITKANIASPKQIGKFTYITIDAETPGGELSLSGTLFDQTMPYQAIQVIIMASRVYAKKAKEGFNRILKSLSLDFTISGTVGDKPFIISNHCQNYWIVTDTADSNIGDVVFILQEPHWDYTGHWNLHQGLKVFFEDNPGLSESTVFLAEGVKALSTFSVEPICKVEPKPDAELIRTVLQSYLVTGYITYDWTIGGTIPIIGTENWPLYQESAKRWLTDDYAPWAVTVAARNFEMVKTLTTMRKRYSNPILFVGGMHLHKIDADLYFKGHAALTTDSLARDKTNQGIIDLLEKQGLKYIYIEPVPSTRNKEMDNGVEMERYRQLFQAQQAGEYRRYLENYERQLRRSASFGSNYPGVTVSPNSKKAAELVENLKSDNDGKKGNKNKKKPQKRTGTQRNPDGSKSLSKDQKRDIDNRGKKNSVSRKKAMREGRDGSENDKVDPNKSQKSSQWDKNSLNQIKSIEDGQKYDLGE